MKIVSWNVNGIRAVERKGDLDVCFNTLSPDILCLQETKATKEQSPRAFDGYYEYWHSAEKKGYSGVAIFSRKEPLRALFGMPEDIVRQYSLSVDSYGNPNEEGRVLALEYDEFFVVSVYTPNAKDDLSRLALRHAHWDPAFLAYILRLEKEKPVIFCGDLNVAHTEDDLARPKENRGKKGFTDEEREGIQEMVSAGFVDSFRMFTKTNGNYTWWSHYANARERNVGWRIDYAFVSPALSSRVASANIHAHIFGSDHCPISLELLG